jgi:hypothetical protein
MLAPLLLLILVSSGETPANPSPQADRLVRTVIPPEAWAQIADPMAAKLVWELETKAKRAGVTPPPELVREATDDLRDGLMSYEAFVEKAARRYQAHFDERELEGLLAFYESPIGRRTIREVPLILEEIIRELPKDGERVKKAVNKWERRFLAVPPAPVGAEGRVGCPGKDDRGKPLTVVVQDSSQNFSRVRVQRFTDGVLHIQWKEADGFIRWMALASGILSVAAGSPAGVRWFRYDKALPSLPLEPGTAFSTGGEAFEVDGRGHRFVVDIRIGERESLTVGSCTFETLPVTQVWTQEGKTARRQTFIDPGTLLPLRQVIFATQPEGSTEWGQNAKISRAVGFE